MKCECCGEEITHYYTSEKVWITKNYIKGELLNTEAADWYIYCGHCDEILEERPF